MKILLTGANGFTGAHFTDWALSAGHSVVPLTSDLTDRQAVFIELKSQLFDAVVHLAAISFVAHNDNVDFYCINTVGTTHLLESLVKAQCKPHCVLIASSANVYGNCQHSPINEEQKPHPINHYAASKLAMEHLALAYTEQLPIVLARPFNYTGPGQAQHFLIPKLVAHFAKQAPIVELGNMNVEREYNSIDFVCKSYLYLLEKGVNGNTYNVCTGQTYNLYEVLALLQSLTGHKIHTQVNPSLVRPNEIHRLCGDPSRLSKIWANNNATWPQGKQLKDTLAKMLDAL